MLADSGKKLVIPVLCTILVIPVLRPAASYYPDNLFTVVATNLLIDRMELHLASF
jgi:hypothetical protein